MGHVIIFYIVFFHSRPNELWVSANDFSPLFLFLLFAASENEWEIMCQFEIVDDTFQLNAKEKEEEMCARFPFEEFKNVCPNVYGRTFTETDSIVRPFFFECKTMTLSRRF